MTPEQIKHMVDRFLGWKLPEDFNPDGGISFKRTFNDHTPQPMKREPIGTNLLTATQAEAMVRHMVGGMPRGPEYVKWADGVVVTVEDAAALENDRLHFGTAYVESAGHGFGRRIAPESIRR